MILSLETSAEPASISLETLEGVVTSHFPNKNQVNVPLAEELETLLDKVNDHISLILVGSGPGSYSGARVGLATAEAIALTHDCPVVTIPSIHGIDNDSEKPLALIGDARRGSYFIITATSSQDDIINPQVEIIEEKAFLESYNMMKSSHSLFTFESIEKLPYSDKSYESVKQVSSSSEQLIKYWNTLSKAERDYYLNSPKEVLYLRPPNITKAKNPFA